MFSRDRSAHAGADGAVSGSPGGRAAKGDRLREKRSVARCGVMPDAAFFVGYLFWAPPIEPRRSPNRRGQTLSRSVTSQIRAVLFHDRIARFGRDGLG
jgi:hypothetical protein